MIDPSKPYFSPDWSPPPQGTPPPQFRSVSRESSGEEFKMGNIPVRHAGGRRGRSMTPREAEAEAKHVSARSPAPGYSAPVGGPLGTHADIWQPPASDEQMRMKPRGDLTMTHFGLPSPGLLADLGGGQPPSPMPRRILDAGRYLSELAKDWKGNEGRKLKQKVQTDIGRQVNFNDPSNLPIDVIRHIHGSGDITRDGIIHRLDPAVRQHFHDELRFREVSGWKPGMKREEDHGGGGARAVDKAKTPQLPPDVFQPPPTTHASDGRISLFNWAHNMGKSNPQNWKGENPYDIHTWRDAKLESLVKHEVEGKGNEFWTIGSAIPSREKKGDPIRKGPTGESTTELRNRYLREKAKDPDQTAHRWRAHLLRHADRHLLQAEIDRRNTPGAHKKLTYYRKSNNYKESHRVHQPDKYQRTAPHQTPRGIGNDKNMGPLPHPDSLTGGPPKQKPG